MKSFFKYLTVAGLLGTVVIPVASARAQVTEVFFVGGNATVKLIQDRWAAKFGGTLTKNAANTIFRYTGAAVPGVAGTVTADFNLTGGAVAVVDLRDHNNVAEIDGTTTIPVAAISITAPETIGVSSSVFTKVQTLVSPVVFIKSTTTPNDLAGITNITQRNASYVESSGGTLPTGYFGGSNNDPNTSALYFVGRNTLSAVRQVIDANIYFSGAAINYTTNSSGAPIPYVFTDGVTPWGAYSGTEVKQILTNINNSIGTVSAGDAIGQPQLSYEGVPFSTGNVINGQYPLWGIEQYLYWPSGTFAPTTAQKTVITALINAIKDTTWEHDATGAFVKNGYVSLTDLQVTRTGDGGPITSILY